MYRHIMVPLDGSELAECVFPHLEAVAKGCRTRIVTFVRVVAPLPLAAGEFTFTEREWQRIMTEDRSEAENYLKQLATQLNYGRIQVRTEVLTGPVADSLADWAMKNEVDLIIIATHGRSGISRWVWGSVADRVLRSANVPVLTVRATAPAPEKED